MHKFDFPTMNVEMITAMYFKVLLGFQFNQMFQGN